MNNKRNRVNRVIRYINPLPLKRLEAKGLILEGK